MNPFAPVLDLLGAPPTATPLLTDHDGRVRSAADLHGEALALAAALGRHGIGRGDRVALWLPNCVAWLAAFAALAQLGAIAVAVNTRFRAHEVGDIVGRAGCRALLLWPGFNDIDFAAILAEVECGQLAALDLVVTYGDTPLDATVLPGVGRARYADLLVPPAQPLPADGGADCAVVIFTTSGTTRAPKFVCHDQATVVRHARDVARALGLGPHDCLLQALPLCGVFGFTQALAGLAAGTPTVLEALFDATRAGELIRARGVTHLNGSDEMLDRLLATRAEARPFPTLERFGFAAFNPALEDLVERAEARGIRAFGLYGMSECHAFYALQDPGLPTAERARGGGRPVAATARVRVRDPVSGELLGVGATGELEVAGPSLFREYFGDPQATRAARTDDGFLRTGDLGYLEADGRFCYLARMGDVLRLAGFLVSPLEIEAVLDQHPAVAASQVVAIDLDGRPQAVAFVLPAAGAVVDEAAVIAHCAERLAGYKRPRRVFTLAAFPTTAGANGTKIQKARLRALAAAYAAGTDTPPPQQAPGRD